MVLDQIWLTNLSLPGKVSINYYGMNMSNFRKKLYWFVKFSDTGWDFEIFLPHPEIQTLFLQNRYHMSRYLTVS